MLGTKVFLGTNGNRKHKVCKVSLSPSVVYSGSGKKGMVDYMRSATPYSWFGVEAPCSGGPAETVN